MATQIKLEKSEMAKIVDGLTLLRDTQTPNQKDKDSINEIIIKMQSKLYKKGGK